MVTVSAPLVTYLQLHLLKLKQKLYLCDVREIAKD